MSLESYRGAQLDETAQVKVNYLLRIMRRKTQRPSVVSTLCENLNKDKKKQVKHRCKKAAAAKNAAREKKIKRKKKEREPRRG